MRTKDYIDLARPFTGTGSDYAVAKLLGISEAAVNLYRQGKRTMDNTTAHKLARLLGSDLEELIAAAEIERATDPALRKEWRTRFQSARARAAALASLILAALILPHGEASQEAISDSAQGPASASECGAAGTRAAGDDLQIMRHFRHLAARLWRALFAAPALA